MSDTNIQFVCCYRSSEVWNRFAKILKLFVLWSIKILIAKLLHQQSWCIFCTACVVFLIFQLFTYLHNIYPFDIYLLVGISWIVRLKGINCNQLSCLKLWWTFCNSFVVWLFLCFVHCCISERFSFVFC